MIVVKWSFPGKLISQNKGEKSSVVHSTVLYPVESPTIYGGDEEKMFIPY